MIDRRDAIAGIAALFGAELFAPLARAAGAGAAQKEMLASIPDIGTAAPSALVFTDAQRKLVAALAERVLPATDTPGATEAGVPAFIEKLLADWSYPAERAPIVEGLDRMDARSRKDFRVPAAAGSPQQHDVLLRMAMEKRLVGAEGFFEPFRQMVVAGYYTSEVGMTLEREYLPVPGRYDGSYPYADVNKVFSA